MSESEIPLERGLMLRLQTGVDVALVESRGRGWWRCLVIASTHPAYPVGGYDLSIHEDELESGILLEPQASNEQPFLVTFAEAKKRLGIPLVDALDPSRE